MTESSVETKSSKSLSALTAITSLVTSLFPNTVDSPQLHQIIGSLVNLADSTQADNADRCGQPTADQTDTRRERHRRNERIRHNKTIELIRQLSEWIGINNRHETQANILSRAARYVLFLTYLIEKLETETTDDGIDLLSDEWLQTLYPLYQRSYEEAKNLIQSCCEEEKSFCGSEASVDSLTQTSDHFLSLIN